MENEEKEVLVDVSEESETEQSDYFIEENIIGLLERNKHSQQQRSDTLFIISCIILFICSTILLITLPVYIEESSRCEISGYGKISTLVTGNVILFTAFWAAKKCLQKCMGHPPKPTSCLYMCLPSVLQSSFLASVGSISVFQLANEELISCHLQDPLKGCVVVFALLFYFIFSKTSKLANRISRKTHFTPILQTVTHAKGLDPKLGST